MNERNQLAARLKDEYLPSVTQRVADKVFDKAWEDGHANGVHEVEMHYEEIAVIAQEAWEAGRKREIDSPISEHVRVTGCNLTQQDFLPGDPPCADGGTVDEHPRA